MRVLDCGDYLRVFPQEGDVIPTKMLMGWSQRRGSSVLQVENNLVNQMVLGIYKPKLFSSQELLYGEALEDYQKADVAKMCSLRRAANFNPMGLGKTVETIIAMKELGIENALIVTPKPICLQWESQIKKWWPKMAGYIGVHDPDSSICIINYEKLNSTQTLTKLKRVRHDCLVFDEGHWIKNRTSKRTNNLKEIPADCIFGLTGTPITRYPDDLWSLLHGIDWRYSGKYYWNFVNHFCDVVEGEHGRDIRGITKDPAKLALLNKLIGAIAVRNESVETAYGKQRIYVPLAMAGSQKKLYRKIRDMVFEELPENCTISNGAVLAMRLMQATSWPGLFEPGCAGIKFEWILERCRDTDEQIVVFTKFEQTARALVNYLGANKVRATSYTGKMSNEIQQRNKKLFVDGKVQVIVGTIKAMGEGVDELQTNCRIGIMVDRDWSPEINEQCEERLHRRGQKLPVVIYYLDCKGTFDKHVDQVNLEKSDSIRAALQEVE